VPCCCHPLHVCTGDMKAVHRPVTGLPNSPVSTASHTLHKAAGYPGVGSPGAILCSQIWVKHWGICTDVLGGCAHETNAAVECCPTAGGRRSCAYQLHGRFTGVCTKASQLSSQHCPTHSVCTDKVRRQRPRQLAWNTVHVSTHLTWLLLVLVRFRTCAASQRPQGLGPTKSWPLTGQMHGCVEL
jgi:hypothetical protein